MTSRLRGALILAAGAAAVHAPAAGPAAAQVEPYQEPPTFPTALAHGFSLSAGAGVVGFSDRDTRDFLGTGGVWDVRLTFGTRAWIGVEAAYFGSRNDIDAAGLDADAYLLGTGLESNAIVNLAREEGIRPYALVGIGWTRFSIQNESFNNSGLRDDDDLLVFPIGAGVAYEYESILVDARAQVRSASGDDLLDVADETSRLDTWAVSARFGWVF